MPTTTDYDPIEPDDYKNPAQNDKFFFDLLQKNILEVRKDGSIWRFHINRYIKANLFQNKQNYWFVRTKYKGEVKSIALGRLVWMAHNKKIVPEGYDIHHIDEDNQNNHHKNLEPQLPKNHRQNSTSFGNDDEEPF